MASIQIMEPKEIRNDKLSEEQISKAKALLNNHINNIELQIGRIATFEDFIIDRIKRTSFTSTQQRFNAYNKIWGLSGRDISQSDLVYSKYFNYDEIVVMSTEEVLSANDDIEKSARDPNLIISHESPPINHFNYENDTNLTRYKCVKCNSIFNTLNKRLCNNCKKEEEFKWFNPISSKGIASLGIGVFILYIIYPILNYYSFLILGAIALLLLMYFQDKNR